MMWWWYWPLGCWRWISIVGTALLDTAIMELDSFACAFFFPFYLFISNENVLLLLPADGINCATLLVVIHALLFLLWLLKITTTTTTTTKKTNKNKGWKMNNNNMIFWGVFSFVQIVLAVINDDFSGLVFFPSLLCAYEIKESLQIRTDTRRIEEVKEKKGERLWVSFVCVCVWYNYIL